MSARDGCFVDKQPIMTGQGHPVHGLGTADFTVCFPRQCSPTFSVWYQLEELDTPTQLVDSSKVSVFSSQSSHCFPACSKKQRHSASPENLRYLRSAMARHGSNRRYSVQTKDRQKKRTSVTIWGADSRDRKAGTKQWLVE